MTFLFDWMALLFIGFVFIISSLVILYRDDYMFGDLHIVRFIVLVLIFVISIIWSLNHGHLTMVTSTLKRIF
jgi:NADH:ubiquinone oxidoreductase subunit 5 (subunit L)/multisubunit Na+/H+ antiporter MnhA subunit